MKSIKRLLPKAIITFLGVIMSALATFAADEPEQSWQYINAQDLRIINKGWDNTLRPYTRIPAYLKDSVRPELWERSQCSSGIGVRFATNSKRIGVKYELLWDTHLIHMADTGLKGTDLYIFEGDSTWRHVNTNRPYVQKNDNGNKTKWVESTYVSNLDGEMHDYIIYFPLYDGVNELFVKIDSGTIITPGRDTLIDPSKKIIAYGTSILQGGCASRTGMAATNIIGRELNCEVVNIGISGEGKMDNCMARAMAQIEDADLFLIDPVPNCTEMMCDTLTYDFINILRQARPDIPILMLEGPLYPYYRYDNFFNKYLPAKNAAFRRNYDLLKAENPDNLYYVTAEGLDGVEDDGTVDGIHLTDLGFRHYANKMIPILRPLIHDRTQAYKDAQSQIIYKSKVSPKNKKNKKHGK